MRPCSLPLHGKPKNQATWDAWTHVQSSDGSLRGAACHLQDGTEYYATKHAHMTSTSAHINPPTDPVPLDTSDPYSRKGDEETVPRTVRGTPNVERQAVKLPFTGRPGH